MSVVVSQRNRAVTQAAIEAVVSARRFEYTKLFALPGNHNLLDGTFKPFTSTSDCGWWGDTLSDADGYLPEPAELVVNQVMSAHTFTIRGVGDCYPVEFSISLLRNGTYLTGVMTTDNQEPELTITLDRAYEIDEYRLIIYRISAPYDVVKVATASFDVSVSNLMKEPSRRIRGKVEVTYANALQGFSQDDGVPNAEVLASEGAHGASALNLTDTLPTSHTRYFTLYDNKLDGNYKVIGPMSRAGWWPKTLPVGTEYAVPQVLSLKFSLRNIYSLSIQGDELRRDYPVDFLVELYRADQVVVTKTITGATSATTVFNETFHDVDRIDITIYKASRPNRPAVLTEVSITASILYEDDALISVDLLEELSYEDAVEKLGGVSANELTVVFSNADKSFYFNNPNSPVAGYLKKNRRIRAWLGVDTPDHTQTIWSPLGTYWTYDWDIPVGSLTAKAVAFDTIGLLGTRTYFDHKVYRNKSIGWLLENILTSAKQQLSFLTWRIEEELYNTIIPVAWFTYGSYAAALNRLASCDFVNIFCDREGRIIATRRLSGVASPDDIWSDSNTVIDKRYPTLNTMLPNYIDVKISRVAASLQEVLSVKDTTSTVKAGDVLQFDFQRPAEEVTDVTISATASYTYEWYSWGMRVTFTSDGILQSVLVNAVALTVDTPTSVHLQDDVSIADDGIVPCSISSDFIQSAEQALEIANYLRNKLSTSVYDAEVKYRGDISLSLNNKIMMPEGIAPDNLYIIKRHELHWNGALTGSARLGT